MVKLRLRAYASRYQTSYRFKLGFAMWRVRSGFLNWFTNLVARHISLAKTTFHDETTSTAASAVWPECLIIVQIPPLSETLHFRAYAESVGEYSLIAWATERLRQASSGAADIIVAVGKSEEECVRTALTGDSHTSIVSYSSNGRSYDFSQLAHRTKRTRILLVDLAAVLLPGRVFEELLLYHTARANIVTRLVQTPCAASPTVMEAKFAAILAQSLPTIPDELEPAIDALERIAQSARNKSLIRIERMAPLSLSYQEERGWPYFAGLEKPEHVRILQLALAKCDSITGNSGGPVEVLDHWSEASREYYQTRFGAPCSSIKRHIMGSRTARHHVMFVQVPSAFSGVEQVLVTLAEGVGGSESGRCTCSALIAQPGTLTDRLNSVAVDVRIAGHDFSESTVHNYLYSRRVLDEIRPDIIHAHTLVGIPFLTAVAERGVPFVQHVHVASESALALLKHQIALASEVIAVSQFVKRRVIRLGVCPQKIHVVPNAVARTRDVARDSLARTRTRAICGIPDDAYVVLVVARFAPNKRHDVAFDAFAIAQTQIPNAYLLFAGEAFPAERATLEALKLRIKQQRLGERVRILGFWRDMSQLYAAADVLVLPSEDDPLPMAIMEAMVAGVPVIAACSGGSPEMIVDGESGFLVEPGHVTNFATAVKRVLLDEEVRGLLTERAMIRCQAEYTVPRFIERIRGLYDQVLDRMATV